MMSRIETGASAGRPLPSVAVLATGGTISGEAPDPDNPTAYESGVVGVDTLLSAAPDITRHADITGVQVANIGSEHMTEDVWLRLAETSARFLAEGADGVVILHGTDTMEESALFLALALPTGKPVVLTGAMRPANAVGADGPMNILNAVRIAASPAAAGRGVMVAISDRIFDAHDVAKTDTLGLDAFAAPARGPVGVVVDGEARFLRPSAFNPALRGLFEPGRPAPLPRVDIIYGHAGQTRDLVDAAVVAGARGLVTAGVGMGHVHRDVLPALIEAAAKGVAVVCASRVGRGMVPYGEEVRQHGFIAAGPLNPQKARVLLQVALTRTGEPSEIGKLFDLC